VSLAVRTATATDTAKAGPRLRKIAAILSDELLGGLGENGQRQRPKLSAEFLAAAFGHHSLLAFMPLAAIILNIFRIWAYCGGVVESWTWCGAAGDALRRLPLMSSCRGALSGS